VAPSGAGPRGAGIAMVVDDDEGKGGKVVEDGEFNELAIAKGKHFGVT
jgi:hypothetical protein